jgi:hypothetical protein
MEVPFLWDSSHLLPLLVLKLHGTEIERPAGHHHRGRPAEVDTVHLARTSDVLHFRAASEASSLELRLRNARLRGHGEKRA